MNDIEKLIKEIEDLVKKLDQRSMGEISSAQSMETFEKRLNAKVGLLTSKNLLDTNKKLEELTGELSGLKGSIGSGITSNQKSANSIRNWTIALVFATICLAFTGARQAYLLNKYTKSTQRLSMIAQEQLDLQLQPALMINAYDFGGIDWKVFNLVNIGNGTALNIEIDPDDKNLLFVRVPNIVETKEEKLLFFVKGKNLSDLSEKEIERKITRDYNFADNAVVSRCLFKKIA